jgi:hypothetical protein
VKAGAWDGGVVWLAALVFTHVTFGGPLARAHTLARKEGLVGVDRGQRTVGRVCVLVAIVALALCAFGLEHGTPTNDAFTVAGLLFTRATAVVGGALGAIAASFAFARERRRKTFVSDAELGKIQGYRVATTAQTRVLVRISHHGGAYREAELAEEIYREDRRTEIRRPTSSANERK